MCLEELQGSVANHCDGETDSCSAVEELIDAGLRLQPAECGLDIQFTDLRHESMVPERWRLAEEAVDPVWRGQRPLSAPKSLASMVVSSKGDHEWTG
jgi:hypothetical protein